MRRALEPFPDSLDAQRGLAPFNAHHCLRQLALIEFPEKSLEGLPLDHAALLEDIRERRQQEVCEYQLWSEARQGAIRRLVDYSLDDSRGYANARFLKLTVENTDGRAEAVRDVAAAQVARSGVRRRGCRRNSSSGGVGDSGTTTSACQF